MSTTPKTDTDSLTLSPKWIRHRLFEQVPFNIAVIDRDFNIVDANENFREYFGEWQGKKCYAVYKKLDEPCPHCTILDIFEDGLDRVVDVNGIDQHGRQAHYVGHCSPLRKTKNGPVDYVFEMSVDVTETKRWQQEYQILFDRVPCFVTVIDENYRIVRANEAFRESFGDVIGERCYKVYKRRKTKCPNCPAKKTFKDGRPHKSRQVGISRTGKEIDYSVTTTPLMRGGDRVAHVIEISTDISDLKRMEKQVIEAERLSAVGQTVAGLAHSVKNILMGLEGGKYIVSLGLDKNDKDMINQGWEMLDRNLEKTTTLVKDFLSFSKGRLPELKLVDPKILVSEITALYKDIAAQSGIELKSEVVGKIRKTPLDPDGIHTCLTNLVSNAIDACLMGDQKGSEVLISLREEGDRLVIEVTDNGAGIDYDIKQKVFTSFFTTKGGEGTGLGLLTTRKIVHEHGGSIQVDSEKGEGARFRIEFPRSRLKALLKETTEKE